MLTTNVLTPKVYPLLLLSPLCSEGGGALGPHQLQLLKPVLLSLEATRFCSLQITVALCIWSTDQTRVESAVSAVRDQRVRVRGKPRWEGTCMLPVTLVAAVITPVCTSEVLKPAQPQKARATPQLRPQGSIL